MKNTLQIAFAFALALLLASMAVLQAQDAAVADPEHNKVVFENDQVRVLLVTLGPGAKSPVVERGMALTLALTDRNERITSSSGPDKDVSGKAGQLAPVSGKIASENLAQQPMTTLVVEYKTKESRQAAMTSLTSMAKMGQPSGLAGGEATALAVMRTINTAEYTYRSTYNKGFTDGLNRMGQPAIGKQPDENHADFVDPTLAGFADGGTNFTFLRNGYRFTYTPGPGGHGNVAAYTVVAQPAQYGVSGSRSFYTDQTAIIRWTSDNRPATASDPTL
jgi:hypothetical protein